ncbi:XRE family transcriptional regulator [Burkholderia contaminans]|uniref:XRE family transcriptional regulator n=1 Tax=Burkholderia contaminans TaxID=488447 RepID=A0A3N8S1X4_9BURK|nr:XRE family transcriptional regulator [Burkholderia contaminans]
MPPYIENTLKINGLRLTCRGRGSTIVCVSNYLRPVSPLSPFSEQLRALRLRYGVRQSDLAKALGVEQAYVSAIELGTKGPPSQPFVDQISKCLELSEQESSNLDDALRLSQRRLVIPHAASSELYAMCNELRVEMERLTSAQIRAIRAVIAIRQEVDHDDGRPVIGRVVRKDKEEAEM